MRPVPASPDDWLADRRFALDEGLRRLAAAARAGAIAGGSIEDGVLRVERTEAAVPGGAADLVADLYRRMPEARITDILLEVDDATRFTEAFTHLRTGDVLLAEGINLGLRKMAEATTTHGFRELMRIARWHVEGRRVRPSVGRRRRGPGRATDGRLLGHRADRLQRRPVLPGRRPGRSPQLNLVNARYGAEPSVKAYSHVSDRFSPFATQTIPATVHEAPYILDGLLMNETGRRVREQYADTGGLHRPRLRRVLDPRLRVCPAHPGPALEAPLRVRTRGRPEAPAPAGQRQGKRGPDRPELGGHPTGGGHHGRRDHAAEPAPAQASRVSAPERAGGGPARKSAASNARCS